MKWLLLIAVLAACGGKDAPPKPDKTDNTKPAPPSKPATPAKPNPNGPARAVTASPPVEHTK